ncbi:MAG: hypothetical protein JXR07_19900 [Reichenbachiella sp.]
MMNYKVLAMEILVILSGTGLSFIEEINVILRTIVLLISLAIAVQTYRKLHKENEQKTKI